MNTQNGVKVTPDNDRSDEEYILSLPPDESDKFERKGTRLLDLSAGATESEVRSELAEQLQLSQTQAGDALCMGSRTMGPWIKAA